MGLGDAPNARFSIRLCGLPLAKNIPVVWGLAPKTAARDKCLSRGVAQQRGFAGR